MTYARQLAWLGAVPEKTTKSRIEQIQTPTLAQRDEDGATFIAPAQVHLPEIPGPWQCVCALFFASGQATNTGMGLTPLSWQELKAFREENGLKLTLWEKAMLKKMSEAYCAESHKATDPKRPAPYKPQIVEEEIDHIGNAQRIREQLNLLRGSRK